MVTTAFLEFFSVDRRSRRKLLGRRSLTVLFIHYVVLHDIVFCHVGQKVETFIVDWMINVLSIKDFLINHRSKFFLFMDSARFSELFLISKETETKASAYITLKLTQNIHHPKLNFQPETRTDTMECKPDQHDPQFICCFCCFKMLRQQQTIWVNIDAQFSLAVKRCPWNRNTIRAVTICTHMPLD